MQIKLWLLAFLVGVAFVPVPADAQTSLHFVPIAPCRVVNTRGAAGSLGAPSLAAGATRDFPLPSGGCGLPSNAAAYALTVTVLPAASLTYLRAWPTGQAQPVSTVLNSTDGRTKSSFAIIQAGSNGSITAFASDATDLILDVQGYFVSDTSQLAFYPLTPCRIADTRHPTDNPIAAGSTRAFAVAGACNVPSNASAYLLNLTAVPSGGDTVAYLTAWAYGSAQPGTSNVSATTGVVTANSAIVQAGSGGQIAVFASNPSDLVIDVYGYFAPPSSSGLGFYPVPQCRVVDTRQSGGPIGMGSTLRIDVGGSSCQMLSSAGGYLFNTTAIPTGGLGYVTLWADGLAQPLSSLLNATDGVTTNNAAVVGQTAGFVDAFASNPTQLVVDAFGYFAPDNQSTVNIGGTVTLGGAGLSGVAVTLSGTASGVATTNGSGNYSFTVPYGGSYILTPALAGYIFTPPSQTLPAVTSNQSASPFVAQAYFPISGQVITQGAGSVAGVTITLGGSASGTTTTDSNGNYSFTVLAGGTYSLVPSSYDYTFNPRTQTLLNVTAPSSASPFYITVPGVTATEPSKEYIHLAGQLVAVENPILPNPVNLGFETATLSSSWPLTSGNPNASIATSPHSGADALLLNGPAGSWIARDIAGLAPGQQYVVSAWLNVASSAVASLSLDDGAGGAVASTTQAATSGWQYISLPFTVDSTGDLRVHLGYFSGSGNIYWDDVSVSPAVPLTNYGFESGTLASWPQIWLTPTDAVVTSPVHSGKYSAQMSGPAGSGIGADVDGVAIGAQYVISAWVNTTSGAARLHLNDTVNTNTGISAGQPQASGWHYISLPFTVDFSGKICLHLWTDGGTGPIYWDDVSVLPAITVGNYGFEAGTLSSWTLNWGSTPSITTSQAHSGLYSLMMTGPANTGIGQDVTGLLQGQQYTVSAWVNVGAGATAALYLDDAASSTTSKTVRLGATNGWSWISLPFTVDSTGVIRIHLWYSGGSGAIYWDDVSVTP